MAGDYALQRLAVIPTLRSALRLLVARRGQVLMALLVPGAVVVARTMHMNLLMVGPRPDVKAITVSAFAYIIPQTMAGGGMTRPCVTSKVFSNGSRHSGVPASTV